MLDLKYLEQNFEIAQKALKKRGNILELDNLLELIKKRREIIMITDELKHERNKLNSELKKADKNMIEQQRDKMRELSSKIKTSDHDLKNIEQELSNLVLQIPNIPHDSVPMGAGEQDNVEVKKVLDIPKFNFEPRDHIEIGDITNIIDMPRAAKISGSRFSFLSGAGARLNRALLQYFCDYHVGLGDTELAPPYMVREQAMINTGQFPKFYEEAFRVDDKDNSYFLIPTAEVPVTNFYADEIISSSELPKRFCAYSACFRAEAGAAGRDTRGIIRLHQFEKVEMVRFCAPEQSMSELENLVSRASDLLTSLELPHRIVNLCGGDLGFHAEKTYDLEVYLPGQKQYREISSCSSLGGFQARRAKIRMRHEKNKPEYLATLNGSGLPLGRTIVAILENHQQADGSVKIPKVLWPYMQGQKIITAK